MKTRVRYRRARFAVECRRPAWCEWCRRPGRVELHHWKYAYTTKEVRKDPPLALKNTRWLCFRCHILADAMRKLREAGYGIEEEGVKHAQSGAKPARGRRGLAD
jgi:hypothetical protein